MKTWKDFAPDDPEGLRCFINYQFSQMLDAGYFIELDKSKADQIYNEVTDRTMAELKEYIESHPK